MGAVSFPPRQIDPPMSGVLLAGVPDETGAAAAVQPGYLGRVAGHNGLNDRHNSNRRALGLPVTSDQRTMGDERNRRDTVRAVVRRAFKPESVLFEQDSPTLNWFAP